MILTSVIEICRVVISRSAATKFSSTIFEPVVGYMR